MSNALQHSRAIRWKLITGFSVIILIFLASVSINLYLVEKTKASVNELNEVRIPSYFSLLEVSKSMHQVQESLHAQASTKDQAIKEEQSAGIKSIEKATDKIDSLMPRWTSEESKKNWLALKPLLTQYMAQQKRFLALPTITVDLITNSETVELVNKIKTILNGAGDATRDGLVGEKYMKIIAENAEINSDMRAIEITEKVLISFGVSLCILIAWYTTRKIVQLISNIDSITEQTTHMCSNIVTMLEQAKSASDTQSSGSIEQASSINQITASLDEIERSSAQTLEKAKLLGESAEQTEKKSELGLHAVEESIQGMRSIRDKVQVIAQTILELSVQTQQVGEITAVVNSLAQQSKMLALNASIEAVKAGEAGKGFAVVAAEVKNLAEQSEQSTSQVQKILENIRHATEKAVMATEEGTQKVDKGAELAEKTGHVVRNLGEMINQSQLAAQQIQASILQENVGIEQITTGMNEINQVTNSFLESIQQSNLAIENLRKIARDLESHVTTYKF